MWILCRPIVDLLLRNHSSFHPVCVWFKHLHLASNGGLWWQYSIKMICMPILTSKGTTIIFLSYSMFLPISLHLLPVFFCHHHERAAASDITVTSTPNWSTAEKQNITGSTDFHCIDKKSWVSYCSKIILHNFCATNHSKNDCKNNVCLNKITNTLPVFHYLDKQPFLPQTHITGWAYVWFLGAMVQKSHSFTLFASI